MYMFPYMSTPLYPQLSTIGPEVVGYNNLDVYRVVGYNNLDVYRQREGGGADGRVP